MIRFSLLLLCLSISSLNAVPLKSIPISKLHNKKILYFNGSFDPIHNGHLEIAQNALQHVDYVIMFANHGNHSRKPNRLPANHRRNMLELACKSHKKILTTHMNALQLQRYLKLLHNVEYFGVEGMDVYKEFEAAAHLDKIYLRGITIPPEEAEHSKSPMMVVNATKMLIVPRDNHAKVPKKFLNDRPVIRLPAVSGSFSSTKIRNNVSTKAQIQNMTPQAVIDYIHRHKLYR